MNSADSDSRKIDVIINFAFCFVNCCETLRDMVPPNIRIARMKKELIELTRNPPHGITCWPRNDRNDQLEASNTL